jgi:hypothetical protein
MSKITIDPVKLIEQIMPQLLETVDPLLLQQWLNHNTDVKQPDNADRVATPGEDEAKLTIPASPDLQVRVNDVITFGDGSELRIHVLAPRRSRDDQASEAYYGLLTAISNIQANTNLTHREEP